MSNVNNDLARWPLHFHYLHGLTTSPEWYFSHVNLLKIVFLFVIKLSNFISDLILIFNRKKWDEMLKTAATVRHIMKIINSFDCTTELNVTLSYEAVLCCQFRPITTVYNLPTTVTMPVYSIVNTRFNLCSILEIYKRTKLIHSSSHRL